MKTTTTLLSVTILIVFLGAMFFSLFRMSMGMEMSSGMSDCPFMSHEKTICPLNFFGHIDSWKSVFFSMIPTLMLLLTVAGAVALTVSVAPNLLLKIKYGIPIVNGRIHERTYSHVYRPLQELFSNGILHPKLFYVVYVDLLAN